jgi:hypothetical protein
MDEEVGGRAERRARRKRRRSRIKRRLQKASQKTLGFAHRITHKGPIGKIHKAIQKMVPKPFDVFVKIGDASSKLIHKGLAKTGAIKVSDLSDEERAKFGKKALSVVTTDAAKRIREEARKKVFSEAAKGNPAAQKAQRALEALDITRAREAQKAAGKAKTPGARVKVGAELFEVFKIG